MMKSIASPECGACGLCGAVAFLSCPLCVSILCVASCSSRDRNGIQIRTRQHGSCPHNIPLDQTQHCNMGDQSPTPRSERPSQAPTLPMQTHSPAYNSAARRTCRVCMHVHVYNHRYRKYPCGCLCPALQAETPTRGTPLPSSIPTIPPTARPSLILNCNGGKSCAQLASLSPTKLARVPQEQLGFEGKAYGVTEEVMHCPHVLSIDLLSVGC